MFSTIVFINCYYRYTIYSRKTTKKCRYTLKTCKTYWLQIIRYASKKTSSSIEISV